MMKCPACGARYSASERLCPKDGAVLEHEQSMEEQFIGKTLDGKYRLDSFISRGGMGAVFRGMHVMLNRPVAVKMINADLVTSPEIVRRFQREARAATHLNHPNIVDVYDLGQTNEGTLYIVMELVTGESLKEEIRARGALDAGRIVHILGQVCDGLGVAHKANIVHRDLKPHNIMLTRDRSGSEVAKIVDFGIAKTFEVDSHTQLTADGSTLGTPHYMSPEQATGREIDGRSDIYSLGIILYEMLTGEVPFDDQSLPAVLIKHMSEPPAPPSQRRPDLAISPALEAITLRCLAKEPAARYASAEELGAALRGAVGVGVSDATLPMQTPAMIAGDATIPLSSPAATMPASAAVPPLPAAVSPSRPATHPTAPAATLPPTMAPAAVPPANMPPPSVTPSMAGANVTPVTTRSSRGPLALVVVFLLLLTVAGAGYWMITRSTNGDDQASTIADATPPSPPPATSPAAGTQATSADASTTPSPQTPPTTSGGESGTTTPAAPSSAASGSTAPPTAAAASAAAAEAKRESSAAATKTTPTVSAPRTAVEGKPAPPPSPRASAAAPSAAASGAAGSSSESGAGAATVTPPSAPPAKPAPAAPAPAAQPTAAGLPENPTVSFQCRGAAEICTPLRSEVQTAFERAGLSMRRSGADVNLTAEVTLANESQQRPFGTNLNVKTYAIELEGESPRLDADVPMPSVAPVSADPQFGAERFNEAARKVAPDLVERVRAFWTKRRQ